MTNDLSQRSSQPYRRQIRLPRTAYSEPGSAWLITIVTRDRQPAFTDPLLATIVLALLEVRLSELGVGTDACCVMPDHLHAVVQVQTGNLVDAVADLKSLANRAWWDCGGEGALWQRSFHDRGLRRGEWDDAVRYVLTNPQRAGLVADWWEYPYLGGTVLDDR